MKKFLIISLLIIAGLGIYFTINRTNDNEYSTTAVEAINKYRGENSVNYIIHEHQVKDGEIVFYLRNINNGQIVVSYEYVRKTKRGWKWVYGGGHSGSGLSLNNPGDFLGESLSYQFTRDLSDTEIGDNPFPMIYGIILNPDISRVVVKDYKNEMEKQATIINIRDKFNLYYVFLDPNQGEKFDIITYSADGKELYTKTIDEK